MDEEKKLISQDDRLKLLAITVMANEHYREACKIDMAIQRMLGLSQQYFGDGPLGDLIFDGTNTINVSSFDEALIRGGLEVSSSNNG